LAEINLTYEPFCSSSAQRGHHQNTFHHRKSCGDAGLRDGGDGEIAQYAAVIDSPLERGHVVLFSNNPFWRGQTTGSYFLVFNAILNFDNLTRDGRRTRNKLTSPIRIWRSVNLSWREF
jgi:hypothetical protein